MAALSHPDWYDLYCEHTYCTHAAWLYDLIHNSTELEALELEAFEEAKEEIARETANATGWKEGEMRGIAKYIGGDYGGSAIGLQMADLILCPICEYTYSYAQMPEMISGNDNYDAWFGRGDLIRIPFVGECGHGWNLCIGFHKGNSFIYVER